jgi:hypothetical protein
MAQCSGSAQQYILISNVAWFLLKDEVNSSMNKDKDLLGSSLSEPMIQELEAKMSGKPAFLPVSHLGGAK